MGREKAARKAHGSLGDAVVALRDAPSAAAKFFKKAAPSPARPPPPPVAAVDVLEDLKALGEQSGPGSERAKTDGMARLVRASRGTENVSLGVTRQVIMPGMGACSFSGRDMVVWASGEGLLIERLGSPGTKSMGARCAGGLSEVSDVFAAGAEQAIPSC